MLKLNKLKSLSSRGFSHVEFILLIIVVVVIGAIGTYVFKHRDTSHASGDIFTSLGESVQSPTAVSTITQATITADTATMTTDASVLNTQEYPLVQTYQNAVNTATTALATARKKYDAEPAPRDPTIVNNAQIALNRAKTTLKNELANEQALVARYESAKSQLANDQQSFNATTAGFANSVFYSYICRSPGPSSGRVDLTIGMVASSYESAMQSGAYSPTAAILLNGNNPIALSSGWNYVGTLQLTPTQNAPSGAWLVASMNDIPQTDEVAIGPYPNGTYAAAWSPAVNIASISDCNPPTTTTKASTTPVSKAPVATTKASTTPVSKAPTAVYPTNAWTYFGRIHTKYAGDFDTYACKQGSSFWSSLWGHNWTIKGQVIAVNQPNGTNGVHDNVTMWSVHSNGWVVAESTVTPWYNSKYTYPQLAITNDKSFGDNTNVIKFEITDHNSRVSETNFSPLAIYVGSSAHDPDGILVCP